MNSFVLFIFLAACLMCLADLLLAVSAFRRGGRMGRALGLTLSGALAATVSYALSVLQTDYTLYSVFSSLYFCSVTATVFSLYTFSFELCAGEDSRRHRAAWQFFHAWMVLDQLSILLNIFTGWAIEYQELDRALSHFTYTMKPLYMLHLWLNYIMIALVVLNILTKLFHVPKGYRSQYVLTMTGILLCVGINALYLFAPLPQGADFLDYSLLGYSLAGMVLYWVAFVYPERGMTSSYHSWVFQNLDDGVLLFDYDDRLIMSNEKAAGLLPESCIRKGMTLQDFLNESGLNLEGHLDSSTFAIQRYIRRNSVEQPIRVEQHLLMRDGRRTGRLFILNNLLPERDLLTGFMTENFIRSTNAGMPDDVASVYTMVICDINGLADINESQGHSTGDRAVQKLASEMKEYFPEAVHYIRGREAALFCILNGSLKQDAKDKLQSLQNDLAHLPEDERFTVETAAFTNSTGSSMEQTAETCYRIIRTKKLLDCSGRHSDILNSLIQVLQECDKDTEAHVQRTQRNAIKLGHRLNLNEDELSRLSLLAILHDIGKVGIPLDVLNKPGRLSPGEWNLIKTHVEKGSRIAASSQALKDISDMILYHHERWDGHGYPKGLKGDDIPLLSRVIAVVDSYDAMVHNRSYRRALGEEHAREELKRCAGTQFDPHVVDAFLKMLEEQDLKENKELEPADTCEPVPSLSAVDWSSAVSKGETHELYVHPMVSGRYITEIDWTIISVDEGFTKLTGYTREDVERLKLTHLDLLPEEDKAEYVTRLAETVANNSNAYLEHRLRTRSGAIIHVFCFGRLFYDSVARCQRSEIIITDAAMSWSVRSLIDSGHERAAHHLALWESEYSLDPLTGLLNYEDFRSSIKLWIDTHQSGRLMMLMVDIDHFKEYNDVYGHHAGDEFLVMAAQSLTGSLRDTDLACRVGGDEFAAALFFPEKVSDDTMRSRGQEICSQMNMILSANRQSSVTVSIGGVILDPGSGSLDKLYEAADTALTRSKESGRARCSYAELPKADQEQ